MSSTGEPIALSTLVHLHHYGFCTNGCYKLRRDKWSEGCEARAAQYEGYLNEFAAGQINAVLDRLASNSNQYDDRNLEQEPFYAIWKSDVEAERQKLKGLVSKEERGE